MNFSFWLSIVSLAVAIAANIYVTRTLREIERRAKQERDAL
jgi:hypothetical protein